MGAALYVSLKKLFLKCQLFIFYMENKYFFSNSIAKRLNNFKYTLVRGRLY